MQTDGGRAPRTECKNHLKQIALALHNYHDDNGCFPPAYVADKNGRPMHSWRVLLLPYPVVEVSRSGINWMEPRDLTFDQALRGINPESQTGISSHHEDGAQIALCDGSVRFFKNDFRPNDLRLLLGINDGKSVPTLGEP